MDKEQLIQELKDKDPTIVSVVMKSKPYETTGHVKIAVAQNKYYMVEVHRTTKQSFSSTELVVYTEHRTILEIESDAWWYTSNAFIGNTFRDEVRKFMLNLDSRNEFVKFLSTDDKTWAHIELGTVTVANVEAGFTEIFGIVDMYVWIGKDGNFHLDFEKKMS